MKHLHPIPNRLLLMTVLLCASASLRAQDFTKQAWRSIRDGVWTAGMKEGIAVLKDGVITVKAPGEAHTFGAASELIVLNQEKREPVRFSGRIMRAPGGKAKKTLVAYDLQLHFTDGTRRWCVLNTVPLEKAGEWVLTDYTLKPEKPLRAVRVLCLNNNADTPASFKDISLEPVRSVGGETAQPAGTSDK